MPPLRNDWAAWQFDQAVLWAGLTIENAMQEREEYGPQNARQSRPKYTIDQVLAPEFRLRHSKETGGLRAMIAANPGMVGRWRAT